MGLGNRTARHDTAGMRKQAVDPTQFWVFRPQQRVMTVDGIPGVVTAVLDGPVPGYEAYDVTLVNGLGGGQYTASQLTATGPVQASEFHTADRDYPELGTILYDRPPVEREQRFATKHTAEPQKHPIHRLLSGEQGSRDLSDPELDLAIHALEDRHVRRQNELGGTGLWRGEQETLDDARKEKARRTGARHQATDEPMDYTDLADPWAWSDDDPDFHGPTDLASQLPGQPGHGMAPSMPAYVDDHYRPGGR